MFNTDDLMLMMGGVSGGFTYPYDVQYAMLSGSSGYMSRTPTSVGNRKRFIISQWVKLDLYKDNDEVFFSVNSASTDAGFFRFRWNCSAQIIMAQTYNYSWSTTAVFRDAAGWTHLLLSVDTTVATASDRMRLYVNGVQVTFTASGTLPQNTDTAVNNTVAQYFGCYAGGTEIYRGYAAKRLLVDGYSLQNGDYDITDFGQSYQGVWVAKAYAGSYGTNGCALDFANALDLGEDSSGNENDWTVTGSPSQVIDTPTNNCPVWNPLEPAHPGLFNGNLGARGNDIQYGTVALPKTGKWSYETSFYNTNYNYYAAGIYDKISGAFYGAVYGTDNPCTKVGPTWSLVSFTGAPDYTGEGDRFSHTMSLDFDVDAGSVYVRYDDGVQIEIFSGLNLSSGDWVSWMRSGGDVYIIATFSSADLAYPLPTGFSALMSENMTPALTPDDMAQLYFQDVVTAATSASTSVNTGISGLASEDFLLRLKDITAVGNWYWIDTVRGLGKAVYSNSTDGEDTLADAVTVSGSTITLPDSLLTDGHQYLVEVYVVSAGHFDIVTDAGTGVAKTVAHSLGVAPFLVVRKQRTDDGQNWPVYHSGNTAAPATDYLRLNTTAATADLDTIWNDTAPTASVFSVGTHADVNESGKDFVTYLWADSGLYKPVTYTGNAKADGPFVYLNGAAAAVDLKNTSATGDWLHFNTVSSPANPVNLKTLQNTSGAQASAAELIDIVSNGVKIRANDTDHNGSGNTIIGMAVLSAPVAYSNAR